MTKPKKDLLLQAFHRRGLVSLAGLQRWLSRGARFPQRVRPELEAGTGRWLAAVDDAIATLVAVTGGDGLRTCRNVLATAPLEDVQMWRYALTSGALGAFGSRDEVEPIFLAAESRTAAADPQLQEALVALLGASTAKAEDLLQIAEGAWPIALALVEDMPTVQAQDTLHEVIVYECENYQSELQQKFKRLMTAVTAMVSRRPDLRFTLQDFDRLPELAQTALGDIESILTPASILHYRSRIADQLALTQREAARKELRAKRMRARQIPAQQRVITAITALFDSKDATSGRRWSSVVRSFQLLAACMESGKRESIDRTFNQLLKAREGEWEGIPSAVGMVRAQLLSAWPESSGVALAFLSMPRAVQCRTERNEVSLISDCTSLMTLIEECATREYLSLSKDRALLWSRSTHRFRKLWDKVFLAQRVIEDSELDAIIEWLQLAPRAVREKFDRTHDSWLTAQAARPDFVAAALNSSDESLRAMLLGATSILRYDHACRAVSAADESSASSRLKVELNAFAAKNDVIFDSLAVDGVNTLGVDRTVTLLGLALNKHRLATMFASALDARHPAQVAGFVFRFMSESEDSPARTAWRSLIRAGNDIPQQVVQSIWSGVLDSGTASAVKLMKLRPDVFGPFAMNDLPPEELLVAAVKCPSLVAHFGREFNSAQVLRAVPPALKSLAKRPMLRAVLELAALSHLREIPHLRMLARTANARRALEPGTRFDDRYRTYTLPKRSGGTREISVPDDRLKRLHRRLLSGAFDPVPLHDASHGFRKGRSILTNARVHVGCRLVLNVDIKGFFPNTTYSRVLTACMKVAGGNLSVRGAKLLADICCYGGALPTGAPTSPAIGNLVLRGADAAISKAASASGINYTRYADDLTFSDDGAAKRIIPFVQRVLGEIGYELDAKKTHLYRRGRQQLVTNLVVNDRVNLRRSDRRRIRAAVERRCAGHEVTWHGKPMDDQSLHGRLALLAMIDPAPAANYRRRLEAEASGWGVRRG